MQRLNARGLALSLLWTLALAAGLSAAVRVGEVRFPDEPSLVITDREGRLLTVYLNNREQWCMPLAAETAERGEGTAPARDSAVPEKLVRAVCLYEDKSFFHHSGIDPLAVMRAVTLNIREGKRVSGASTITMQVARLMRPKPRTMANKVREMLRALRLELVYTKEAILRFYLDHAPYGGNIVGVQAASYRYFGKPAGDLTWAEAALLAVLPNEPSLTATSAGWEELRAKRNGLLHRLSSAGFLDHEALPPALREPVPDTEKPFPHCAPHLAEQIRRRYGDAYGNSSRNRPPAAPVRTTLDLDLQRRVEEIVSFHSTVLSRMGIHNAAALVVDNGSGEVRVYVGSQDFADCAHGGQVDGVTSPRSTGSLLKPFLYALAMDDGSFLPATLIEDVPSQFGAFTPQNPDLGYQGLVTVREALVRSLNVPAAAVLQSYGLRRFHRFLESAGITSLFRTAQDYGLPLILGGAEASLLELAMLYRGLASGGFFASLRLIPEDPEGPGGAARAAGERPAAIDSADALESGRGRALISPGASALILEILKDVRRPGVEYYWESYAGSPPLAWKTGTSYGQKDGWALGVNPQWTIGVWVGNFTGQGNPNLRSARCAGPLLFDVFRILPKEGDAWFTPPPDALTPVRLCRETGYRAGPSCADTTYALAPVNARPVPVCPYHRSIYVTRDESYRVNSLCWEPGDYKKVTRLIYPPQVAQLLRERGQRVDELPPFKPGCAGADRTAPAPVRIVYPQEGALVWIPRDLDGAYQKVTLRAAHADSGSTVYWYVDSVYHGETRQTHSRSLLLEKGWHTLVLVDERGFEARRRFFVTLRE